MSVELKGVKELERQLERRFGETAMRRKADDALEKASEYLLKELKKNFEVFKDTGASIDEMHKTKPFTAASDKLRTVVIDWVGPMDRFRLIHLNEHGYTRNGIKYTPRGMGVIAKTLESSESRYRQIIKEELRRSL
ncbi:MULTISPECIES: hypothetical protein [Staphylococcus]|uniref:Uncharacterized protein n=2 Tax=Staphylococcus TaxID=1279 RepID=A0A4Q7CQF4_9STAP|nr:MULTISPECIES: hypothetical protein [Staphylococcus]QPT03592.1 hypothetical protein I6G40_11000 [Staphylococcus carnosus]RZI03042.1 hypothetical protein EIG99_04495 [Staphylococcus condimenti]UQA66315.1 hypothetical protein Sta3580_07035 [Staphylococcus carnosus]UTB78846.1 hypothetical protein A2I62_09885 [Staphylococcus carnosus]UTB88399.1 hypothetical protein A2I63_09885 [Staphylococcus carnosus]